MDNDAGDCSAEVSFADATATDNCSATVTLDEGSLASGAAFPVGETTVGFTAIDPAGNDVSCMFTVTVVDAEDPVITCPDPIVMDNDGEDCSAVVSFDDATATDNCSATVTLDEGSLASGAAFPVGETTVGFTAVDQAGNDASCTFTVTVVDAEDPVITCPDPIVIDNDGGDCSAVVSFDDATATDNCSARTMMKATAVRW